MCIRDRDAEILARHLFQVDGERIKHTVEDNEQQDRSHPVYYSLQEEWEWAVQSLQNLLSRQAYAKCPGTGASVRLKTIKVKGHHADEAAMASIKRVLAARHGVAVADIVATIERRVSQPREDRSPKPLLRHCLLYTSGVERQEQDKGIFQDYHGISIACGGGVVQRLFWSLAGE